MTLTLEISDDSAGDLENRAARSGVALEVLITQSIYIGGTSTEVIKVTVST